MKLIEILGQLPKLKQDELLKIKAAADHLLNKRNDQIDANTQLLYDAMLKCLSSKLPWNTFLNSSSYKEWCKHAPSTLIFIAETFPTVRKRIALFGINITLLGLLAEDLRDKKIPVTMGSMVSNLGRIPQVFENAFPDYKASRLTHLILKQMERGR